MCSECYRTPCHPQCPNAETPEPAYTCEVCGEQTDEALLFRGHVLCRDFRCFQNALRKEAKLCDYIAFARDCASDFFEEFGEDIFYAIAHDQPVTAGGNKGPGIFSVFARMDWESFALWYQDYIDGGQLICSKMELVSTTKEK